MQKIIILAGGSSQRLWPLTNPQQPKQLQKLASEKETLIEQTVARLSSLVNPQDIFLTCNQTQIEATKKLLPPAINYSSEPVSRNTAPAIGLACALIAREDPQAEVLIVPSDTFVNETNKYQQTLKTVFQKINTDPTNLTLIATKTTFPATEYGYLKVNQAQQLEQFIEKPNLKEATRFHQQADYYWNIGHFAGQVATILKLFQEHLPEIYTFLELVINSPKQKLTSLINKTYPRLPAISIDYGLLEKLTKLNIIKATWNWSDIGSWQAIYQMLSSNSKQNLKPNLNLNQSTKLITIDSQGNLIKTTKPTALINLNNLVVVETPQGILICPQENSQEVKQIANQLSNERTS